MRRLLINYFGPSVSSASVLPFFRTRLKRVDMTVPRYFSRSLRERGTLSILVRFVRLISLHSTKINADRVIASRDVAPALISTFIFAMWKTTGEAGGGRESRWMAKSDHDR